MLLEGSNVLLLLALAGVLLLPVIFLFYPAKPKILQSKEANSQHSKVYTLDEVKKHNKRDDCWIIVNDKVYDVTPYVEEHPGGDSILNNAGRDSTEGFFGPQHVTRVFQMIDDFYIGDVKQ